MRIAKFLVCALFASSGAWAMWQQEDRPIEAALPSTVKVEVLKKGTYSTHEAYGAGIIADDGRVLTCRHVVAEAIEVKVVCHDGNRLPVEVSCADEKRDMAILMLPPGHYKAARWSRDAHVADPVYAIGTPCEYRESVASGVISFLGRDIGRWPGSIQFSAPINPGNSGGPLLDKRGCVIGMVVARDPEAQGIGFAIPASKCLDYLQGN